LGFTRLETDRDKLQRGKKVTGGTAFLVYRRVSGFQGEQNFEVEESFRVLMKKDPREVFREIYESEFELA